VRCQLIDRVQERAGGKATHLACLQGPSTTRGGPAAGASTCGLEAVPNPLLVLLLPCVSPTHPGGA
jgi:hypothetical protein